MQTSQEILLEDIVKYTMYPMSTANPAMIERTFPALFINMSMPVPWVS